MSEESPQQPELESTPPPEGTASPNGEVSPVPPETIDPESPIESGGTIAEVAEAEVVVADSAEILVADSDVVVPVDGLEIPVTVDTVVFPDPEALTGVVGEAIEPTEVTPVTAETVSPPPPAVPVPPPPAPTTAPQVKAQPSNLDQVLAVLQGIWSKTAPILRAITIFLLRTTLDLSKFGLVLLNAPEPDSPTSPSSNSPIPPDPSAPASSQPASTTSGPAKVLEDIWRVVLGLVRSRLPGSLRDRTPDRVLSVFVTGVLVLVFWLTSGLWFGKPKPVAVKPPVVEKPAVKEAPPVEKVPPVVKAPPIEKSKPVEKIPPIEKVKPIEKVPPVEKAKPVEKAPPVEPVKPVEKVPIADQEAPAVKVPPMVKAPTAEKPVPVETLPPAPPSPSPVLGVPPVAIVPDAPAEVIPSPVPTPPATPKPTKPTPEQKRLVAVKEQLAKVADRYKEQLVQTVQIDEKRDRLAVTVGAGWFGLDAAQQDNLAVDLFKQAQKLKFSQVEIQDTTQTLLARNPVTGTGMVILQRTTFQSGPET
ncbi:MAG: hypothetical protein SFW36_21495 [Leptolyngbyaceae cyanobacterium bins.59]|nr:hypothetical protein [Leptolyngbyaceae cyanobacterium bins.59]